jgi:NAD(P)-dependent dehydrogenase (short-subunit alcohol dehydrogenase family)
MSYRVDREQLVALLGGGRIAFVSTESAMQVPVEMIHYAVSKAANIVVARGVAETLVGSNVIVNSVIPGPTLAQGLTKRIAEFGKSEVEYADEFFRTVRPTSLNRRFAFDRRSRQPGRLSVQSRSLRLPRRRVARRRRHPQERILRRALRVKSP